MASNEVTQTLEDIKGLLENAKAQLPIAKEFLALLEEANEDTTEVRTLILEAEARIRRWERMLEHRGVTLKAPEEGE